MLSSGTIIEKKLAVQSNMMMMTSRRLFRKHTQIRLATLGRTDIHNWVQRHSKRPINYDTFRTNILYAARASIIDTNSDITKLLRYRFK